MALHACLLIAEVANQKKKSILVLPAEAIFIFHFKLLQ